MTYLGLLAENAGARPEIESEIEVAWTWPRLGVGPHHSPEKGSNW